jgi:hypothetical protein
MGVDGGPPVDNRIMELVEHQAESERVGAGCRLA